MSAPMHDAATLTAIDAAPLEGATPRARPRLGFLGVGWIGLDRMRAVARAGAADVAVLADPSPAARAAASNDAPAAAAVASLGEMLDMGLDGIVIATPSALHAEQAIAALERGVAVFCQKPLARTMAETQRVVDAARANDQLLGVDLSYRYTTAMQRIRALIQGGALGRVYAADLVFHNAYGPDKPWFYDARLSGGGCVMDLGIHLVDLALWALGFPGVTSATSRLFAGGVPIDAAGGAVEDYAEARLDLASGTTVRLACSWRLPAGRDAVIEAAFHGTEGGAAMLNVNGSFYDFVGERRQGTTRETIAAPPDEWGGRAAVEWARRLADGVRYDPACERLVDTAHALDLLYGR
jgi:predicted dehydrogenase